MEKEKARQKPGLNLLVSAPKAPSAFFVCAQHSDPHRHQDVPVLHILIRILGPHLPRALGVLELQPNLSGIPDGLQEIDQVLAVETHYQWIVVIRRFDRVLGLTGIGRRGGEF